MRGPSGKLLCKGQEVDIVPLLEAGLTNPVLLGMMKPAEAQAPSV
jgi:hypothetical protein